MGCHQSISIQHQENSTTVSIVPKKESISHTSSNVNLSEKFNKSSSLKEDPQSAYSSSNAESQELSTKSEAPRTSSTPPPPPFPTLASVVSFRTETPDSSFLLTSPSQRLSLLAASTLAEVSTEGKGFTLLHSLCQQRSSYLLLFKACRNIYTILHCIFNKPEAIRVKYRDVLDNCIYAFCKCIEQSMDFNTLYTTSEELRKLLIYYQFQLTKYTEDQFFKHLYLSDDLSTLLDNLIESCTKLTKILLKDVSFTAQSVQEEVSKEKLVQSLVISSPPELQVYCNLQVSFPLANDSNSDYVTTYVRSILSLIEDEDKSRILAWEQSVKLYLNYCQQQISILNNVQFEIACIIPNISLQQLWRERIPDQSSVYTREIALYIDAELMKDESSLYLTPSSFGYPTTITCLVDALIDIFGAIGKSHKEISIFELARFVTQCEVYWSLVEVVSFWMRSHLSVGGTKFIPPLSQLTPYFTNQSQSLLLRDEQYEVLQSAVLNSPFVILFGMSLVGKTFRLRHILDENVVKDKFHVVWIDCSHIDGADDLQIAMLQSINAQLFLAQSQTELILSDFSSWLNHWTKHFNGSPRTTCLIFDHVPPALLSSLQPFASLIGLNACKLVIVLRDVDNMEALQYVLSTESGFSTMITEDTSIVEIATMSSDACQALIQSYQELALEAQHHSMEDAAKVDEETEEVFRTDTTSGIASGATLAYPHIPNGNAAMSTFTSYSSLHFWNKSLIPLKDKVKISLIGKEDVLVRDFVGLPGLITEFCYQHQELPWMNAKRELDTVSMLNLLTKEEKVLLKCVGGVIGILCADASDESLRFRWRFTMKSMWHLWQESFYCGTVISNRDFLRWQLIWIQLISKGLFKKVGVSLMVSYAAGEEYTLTKEAMCLFSALLAENDDVDRSIDIENIVLSFVKQWLYEFYHVSQDIVWKLHEDAVGTVWLEYHLELFRRIVIFIVRECQGPRLSQTTQNILPLSKIQSEIIPHLVHVWCTFLSPYGRWADLMPDTTLFPDWLTTPTFHHNYNEDFAGDFLSMEKVNNITHVLYFLWEMLSTLMHPHTLPEMKETMESFLLYVVTLRVDISAVYWHQNHETVPYTTDHSTRRVRSAILWTMYEMGKLLWELPDSIVSKDTVYDFLEDLRLVVVEELKQMSIILNKDEKSRHNHKIKSGFKFQGLKNIIVSKEEEDLCLLFKRVEAEICLLLAKITAATIRRVNNGCLTMPFSPPSQHNSTAFSPCEGPKEAEYLSDGHKSSVKNLDISSSAHISGENYHADDDDVSKTKISPSKRSSQKLNASTPFSSLNESSKQSLQENDKELEKNEQDDSLFCLSTSAESTILADPEVMNDFYNLETTEDKQTMLEPIQRERVHSDDEEDESDHSNLVLLLESYLAGYLTFYQDLYSVKIPSPPPMLIASIDMKNGNPLSMDVVCDSNLALLPPPKDDRLSSPVHPPSLTLPLPSSSSSMSNTPKSSINPTETTAIAFFAPSPASSFLPIRTNRTSRNSGGSLLGSAKTLSLRLMTNPLIQIGDLFLQYFVASDAIARTRCLYYYEQALQCLGKSRRESYDYDHFQYAQALYHYARKVLGRYLLSVEISSSKNGMTKELIDLKTFFRDEIMRSYMDIQRLLHKKTHFQVSEEVDACYAKASYYLGMFWYQQQKFDEASWCFGQVLMRIPTKHWLFESLRWLVADAAHYQGNSFSQKRLFSSAITAYVHSLQTRIALPPLSEIDVIGIATNHLQVNGTFEATCMSFKALNSFYRNDSNLSAIQSDKGTNSNDFMNLENPVPSTRRCQKSDREYLDFIKRVADTSYNLAFAYMKEKRFEEAIASFHRALSCRHCYLSLTFMLPIAMTTAMTANSTSFSSISQLLDALFALYPSQTKDSESLDTLQLSMSFASSVTRDHGLYSIDSLSLLSRLVFSLLPLSLLSASPNSPVTPPPAPPSPTFTIILQALDNLAQCQMQCKAFEDATFTYQESLYLKQKILYPEWENVYSYGNLTCRSNVHSSTPIPVELHLAYFTSRQEIVSTFLSLAWVFRQRQEHLSAWLWMEKAVSEAQKLVPFTTLTPTSSCILPPARSSANKPCRSTGKKKAKPLSTAGSSTGCKFDYGSGNEDSVTSGGSSFASARSGGGHSVSSLISKYEDSIPQQHHVKCQQVIKLYVETLEAKAKLCEIFGSAAFPCDHLPHNFLSAATTTGSQNHHIPSTKEAFQRESVRLLQMARTQYMPWFGAQDAHVQELDKKLQSLWSKYG